MYDNSNEHRMNGIEKTKEYIRNSQSGKFSSVVLLMSVPISGFGHL